MSDLRERHGGLPAPKEAEYIWSDIWHLEAHHSTALEGNTLVLREVRELLDHGRAVGAKPLREYVEVRGYADAAEWVYAHALQPGDWTTGDLISLTEIREIHYRMMTPVWQVDPHPEATGAESPGSFRQHDIHAFSGGMTPPTWPLVPSELATWISEAKTLALPSQEPVAERMARIHNAFERVHPFIDGNGRTGRLALNLMLVRLGYPPVVILKKDRSRYLQAMQAADRGEHGALGEIIARAMIENLHRFILPNVAGPARLVPIAALSDGTISIAALRQAAQRGRLDAEKRADGNWHSTRHAVERYKRSRGSHRPGAETDPEVDQIN